MKDGSPIDIKDSVVKRQYPGSKYAPSKLELTGLNKIFEGEAYGAWQYSPGKLCDNGLVLRLDVKNKRSYGLKYHHE